MKPIRKAVLPVGGLGTRFLPATKASPKEMLPVVDRPLVQYAADEAVASGISELVFVTGRTKRAIEDHFDKAYELEAELMARGKPELLEALRRVLPPEVVCVYTRQQEALGLGHAVACARQIVGDEPFAVLLADDLIRAEPPALAQMIAVYQRYGCSVIGVQNVARENTVNYGIIHGVREGERLTRVQGIVEKPSPEKAPSTLAVAGRYLLTPAIFPLLERQERGAGGEIQLTDAIGALLADEPVYAVEIEGRRFDCGDKLGYLQATVEHALEHPELRERFREYLRRLRF